LFGDLFFLAKGNARPRKLDEAAAERELLLALGLADGISVAAVARRLDCSPSRLRRRFPEICRRVSDRFMSWRKARGLEHRESLYQAISDVTKKLRDKGIYPSASKVEESIGRPGALRDPRARQVWQEAKA
jgi:hypothetical protein